MAHHPPPGIPESPVVFVPGRMKSPLGQAYASHPVGKFYAPRGSDLFHADRRFSFVLTSRHLLLSGAVFWAMGCLLSASVAGGKVGRSGFSPSAAARRTAALCCPADALEGFRKFELRRCSAAAVLATSCRK